MTDKILAAIAKRIVARKTVADLHTIAGEKPTTNMGRIMRERADKEIDRRFRQWYKESHRKEGYDEAREIYLKLNGIEQ